MIINLGIQTWDEFLEGSAGQTHFNPKAASSPSPKAWVRAALPDGVGCTLLKLQKGQEGAVEDTPQVSRCALEQVTFLVYIFYIRTLEVPAGPWLRCQRKSLGSEAPWTFRYMWCDPPCPLQCQWSINIKSSTFWAPDTDSVYPSPNRWFLKDLDFPSSESWCRPGHSRW